jgi:hypothetical protein
MNLCYKFSTYQFLGLYLTKDVNVHDYYHEMLIFFDLHCIFELLRMDLVNNIFCLLPSTTSTYAPKPTERLVVHRRTI